MHVGRTVATPPGSAVAAAAPGLAPSSSALPGAMEDKPTPVGSVGAGAPGATATAPLGSTLSSKQSGRPWSSRRDITQQSRRLGRGGGVRRGVTRLGQPEASYLDAHNESVSRVCVHVAMLPGFT